MVFYGFKANEQEIVETLESAPNKTEFIKEAIKEKRNRMLNGESEREKIPELKNVRVKA